MSGVTYTLPQLLNALIEQKGSDLHISTNSPPRLRISGDLLPLDLPNMTEAQTSSLCYSILTDEQKKTFESKHELDLSFNVRGLGRFRANVFMQKSCVGAVFRAIPTKIPTFKDLNLSPAVEMLCKLPRGIILVTGPTGSGKSTTLAAMIDYINQSYQKHIVTIEDPIEFVHQHKNSIINQRELGSDTFSFGAALRSVLRQDPDVILVGEIRDLETISLAVSAAETGHLVFATLHTNSSVATLNRIIDVFPPGQQSQIKTQLSFSLMGILSQQLVKTLKGGRRAAMEIMIPNAAIRNLIREDKIHQLYSAMQIGQENSLMNTMNQALAAMVLQRIIALDIANSVTHDPLELASILEKYHKKQGSARF